MPYNEIRNIVMEFRRSDGKMLSAGTGFPDYRILRADGLTGLGFTYTTTVNPQIPGTDIENMRAEPRYINCEFDCDTDLRERALSFFNPMFVMRLTVEWNGVKRWIEGRIKPVKIATKNIYAKLTLAFEMYCADPMFRDMSDYGKDITFRRGLYAFPFVMLPDRGLIPSYRIIGSEMHVPNPGDMPVPIRVVFKSFTETLNPRITLNNDMFIQVNVTMQAGDELDISTDPRDIHVKLNGQSILNKTDRLSSFFQIPIGGGLFSYQVGAGYDSVSVVVYYTPQYQGV
jgi:hypothetical protein